MIEIDGSHGEGGGQILRTALGLSCLTLKPFRIKSIRTGRPKPGLMPQHLVAVRAAREISSAEVVGDEKGATELHFVPRRVRSGEFSFDIGTAGSVTLVLQTLIPPLLFAGGRSKVHLRGGTHVPFSPSYDYLAEVFLPFLRLMGGEVRLGAESYGFYPRGGGVVRAEIKPCPGLRPVQLTERGAPTRLSGRAAVGNLPLSIAERERRAALGAIREGIGNFPFPAEIRLVEVPTPAPGTFIFLRMGAEVRAGFTALGELGKRAETVGQEAAGDLLRWYESGTVLDPHLADQALIYLALAGGESSFTTSCVTSHLLTNLWVIGKFLDIDATVDGERGEKGRVMIRCGNGAVDLSHPGG